MNAIIPNGDALKHAGFWRFSLQGLLQIVVMMALLLNWWTSHESNSASVSSALSVTIQLHGERIKSLEDSNKEFLQQINDLQRKMDVLVAIAEEQRKKLPK